VDVILQRGREDEGLHRRARLPGRLRRKVVLPLVEAWSPNEVAHRTGGRVDADHGDRAEAVSVAVVEGRTILGHIAAIAVDHEQTVRILSRQRVVPGRDCLQLQRRVERRVDAEATFEDRVVSLGVVRAEVERRIIEQQLLHLIDEVVPRRFRDL
jgi:hypothetical protein